MTPSRPLAALAVVAALVAGAHGGADAVPETGETLLNALGMRMVLVPAGRFRMGSPPGAPLRQEEELLRWVTLTRAFRISATEVTQEQWLALMPTHRSPQEGAERPVTSVSWRDAEEFCRRLSEKEGARYRLPTEAEWERACRAGGEDPPASERDAASWHADNSEGMTHSVGRKKPNAWGLHDMLGNVAEWTLDAYGPYPRVEEDDDPTGPASGSTRVVRGGAYRSFAPALRCAARTGMLESYQLPHVGFRVVREDERPPANPTR